MEFLKKPLFSVYIVILLSITFYHVYYSNKIIPGVFVNDINLGGKTIDDANFILKENLKSNPKVNIKIGDTYTKEINSSDISFKYSYKDTLKKAFDVGRTGPLYKRLYIRFVVFMKRVTVKAIYNYDSQKLSSLIASIQDEAGTTFKEPSFIINESGELDITSGKDGFYLDTMNVGESIIDAFRYKSNPVVVSSLMKKSPTLVMSDLGFVKNDFSDLVNRQFKIYYDGYEWDLTKEDLLSLIIPVKQLDGSVVLGVSNNKLSEWIDEFSEKINRSPKAQELSISDGKVVKFESASDGFNVQKLESKNKIKKALLTKDILEVELIVKVDKASIDDNEYGIKEVIGIGKSKFAHSSKSRIHNIGLAASRINGTLIPPGEVFSFNSAVGEISRKTGYTSAWVISKGRTVLGDGGGVCQVSTTLFRAALNAGLEIVDRRAHSYRVSYYEQDSPPGIDATIYRPSVDFKFRNDTDNYILIVAEFDPDAQTLNFKLLGTKDNRKVEITTPKILSRTAPPAPVYEDDPTLPKGTLKRIESPVAGSKVVFTRKVEKDGKILYNDTFKSNYRAWGAVYKRGIKE